MVRKVVKFFDKLEDKTRGALSRRPILYTFVGGIGVVLFWRGVWMTADEYLGLSGIFSMLLGVGILLMTGLFVSFFIGDRIILSGLKGEKKLAEKTEQEVRTERDVLNDIKNKVEKIEQEVGELNHNRKK